MASASVRLEGRPVMTSERTRTIRYVLAFLFAPLTPVVVLLLATLVTRGIDVVTPLMVWQMLVYTAPFTYLPELCFGVPALCVLIVTDRLDTISFVIAGALVGLLTFAALRGIGILNPAPLWFVYVACIELFAILSTLVFKALGGWRPMNAENGIA
jgi:hypothetical protein